jgi:hypothetical protein
MVKTKTPNQEIQEKASAFVKRFKTDAANKISKRREQLDEIYNETMNYYPKREADWDSVLKVNHANQIEQTVTSRLTAKNPKFIVSLKDSAKEIAKLYYPASDQGSPEFLAMVKQVESWGESIQSYLNHLFANYRYNASLRKAAKSLVRYGNCYGAIEYRVDSYASYKDGKISRSTADEYPELVNISWKDLYLDPRYHQVADSAGVVSTRENVRLSELYSFDGLFNLDKVEDSAGDANSQDRQAQSIYSLMIADPSGSTQQQKATTLTVDKFYGYFCETDDPKDEKIYEIWTLNDSIVIKYKEIPKIPIVSAACFEDPEQHYGIGYVEPILGLQREYNFKMNSSIQYINTNLNHSWFYDPNSGIDPRALANASAPGAIVPVTNGMEAALNGLREIPRTPIDGSYFNQQSELRADMQSLSFTIDPGNPLNRAGGTDTATAVRAKFFEVNTVYADTLKHFEEWLVELAYNILDSVAMNAKNDVVIERMQSGDYKWASPAIFEDAPLRYAVRVEVGSSSFDSIENRREDALAKLAVLERAAQAGVKVDFNKAFTDILGTFEVVNPSEYIKDDLDIKEVVAPTGASVGEEAQTSQPGLADVAGLTKEVVQGNLQA